MRARQISGTAMQTAFDVSDGVVRVNDVVTVVNDIICAGVEESKPSANELSLESEAQSESSPVSSEPAE